MITSVVAQLFPTLDKTTTQIRLIRLQPRSAGETITCRLFVSNLNDKECNYEALSYEWGSATCDTNTISLNGVEFPVGENLWWALHYLRGPDAETIFWIDALCINQSNEEEKNHQVRLMGQIYTRASRVIAWLGTDDEEDFAQAVELINLLNGDSKETRYHIECRPNSPSGPPIWINQARTSRLSMDDVTRPGETDKHLAYSSWRRIPHRTYWSRLWIIQELVLASSLVLRCGNTQVNWDSIAYVIAQEHGPRLRSLDEPDSDPGRPSYIPKVPPPGPSPPTPPGYWVLYRIYQEVSIGWPQWSESLFHHFYLYRKSKCADVRDRIFGLLGISPKCCQDSIPVDYGISCIDLALAVIDHDHRVHQGFRSGMASKGRMMAFVEYLGCENEAERVKDAIEAWDGPLWRLPGENITPVMEMELRRRRDPNVTTCIEGGRLVYRFPEGNGMGRSRGEKEEVDGEE